MSITLGRYGTDENYKVEFVNELPQDKIIIALRSGDCRAFTVTDYRETKSVGRGRGVKEYELRPIQQLDFDHGFTQELHMTAEELLKSDDLQVLFLDTLADLGKVVNAIYYH